MRAFASILCPVLNIHPQPASLVNPLSSPFLVQPQAEVDGRFGNEVEPIEVEYGKSLTISIGDANDE